MFHDDDCVCGHPASDHVRLPGPGGAEECQAEDCDCGCYRDAADADYERRQMDCTFFDYGDDPEDW